MKKSQQWAIIGAAAVVAVVVVIAGIMWINHATAPASSTATATKSSQVQKGAGKQATAADKQRLQKERAADPVFEKYERYGLTYAETQYARNMPISMVGDSLTVGSEYGFKEIFPKINLDAQVGRQATAGPAILSAWADQGQLAHTVIVELGTNGRITADLVAQIEQICGAKRRIFWVGVNAVGREWESDDNALMRKMARKYSNLTFVNWYAESQSHEDWFNDDAVHPNAKGQKYFFTFVAKSVLKPTIAAQK